MSAGDHTTALGYLNDQLLRAEEANKAGSTNALSAKDRRKWYKVLREGRNLRDRLTGPDHSDATQQALTLCHTIDRVLSLLTG